MSSLRKSAHHHTIAVSLAGSGRGRTRSALWSKPKLRRRLRAASRFAANSGGSRRSRTGAAALALAGNSDFKLSESSGKLRRLQDHRGEMMWSREFTRVRVPSRLGARDFAYFLKKHLRWRSCSESSSEAAAVDTDTKVGDAGDASLALQLLRCVDDVCRLTNP